MKQFSYANTDSTNSQASHSRQQNNKKIPQQIQQKYLKFSLMEKPNQENKWNYPCFLGQKFNWLELIGAFIFML